METTLIFNEGDSVWFRVPTDEELSSTEDFSGNNDLRGPFAVVKRIVNGDTYHLRIVDKDGAEFSDSDDGLWNPEHFVPNDGSGLPKRAWECRLLKK